MVNTLLAVKKGMTSTYDARQRRVGATVLEVKPNFVIQIKTRDGKDGYDAIQLGIGTKKSVKKPQLGHIRASGIDQQIRWLREVSFDKADVKPGQRINVAQVFSVGDAVGVTGISKGKGFQGGVRRHGFHGGPKTHGQSDRHRAPGAIGAGTTPGRVYKGKRMAGHMGVQTVSVGNLEVISVDQQNNLMIVKGAVPGCSGSLAVITKLGKINPSAGGLPPSFAKATEGKPEEKVEAPETSESQEVITNAS